MYPEFIITIKKHRLFGYLLCPYFIKPKKDKSFFELKEQVTFDNNATYTDNEISETEKKIVKLTDECSDSYLLKIFSKQKSLKEFYRTLSDKEEKRIQYIREYIERRVIKCLDLMRDTNIKLFIKRDEYNNIYNEDLVSICSNPAKAVFNFIRSPDGSKYFLSIEYLGENMKLTGQKGLILVNSPCRLVLNGKLYYFNDIDGKKLLPFFEKQFIPIPESAEKKYFQSFVLNSIKNFTVHAEGFTIIEDTSTPKCILTLESDWQNRAVFIIEFSYNKKNFRLNNPTNVFVRMSEWSDNLKYTKIIRNRVFEEECINTLNEFGLKIIHESSLICEDTHNAITSKDEQWYKTINWLNENKEKLENAGFIIRQRLKNEVYYTDKAKLELKIKEQHDWFDIYANVQFANFQIPFIRLREHILSGNRELKLPTGEIAILPEEWFTDYKDLLDFAIVENNELRLHKFHFQLIPKHKAINKEYLKSLHLIYETNKAEQKDNTIKTPDIKTTLRPYQIEGFRWMLNLQQNGFGGCLADDMGLGKTLQTLILLKHTLNNSQLDTETDIENQDVETRKIENVTATRQLTIFDTPVENSQNTNKNTAKNKNTTKPKARGSSSLIIMPTSLIHNWQREILKFTPELKTLLYTGTDRERLYEKIADHDIILTSYGIARIDINKLKKIKYLYVILDESQYVKNPASKTYIAITQLFSNYKLILTGTPIENSLTDLWAQMNFLNTGLLGGQHFFNQRFTIPIEKQNDIDQQNKLQTLIKPFVLRRTKSMVAKDLPDLSEQTVLCDMSEEQQSFYEIEKSKIRNLIIETIENKGLNKASFVILQSITKLRQISNHPVMIDEEYAFDSGKFDEVCRHLDNIYAENHKVLIFSSFVKHLKLYQQYFDSLDMKYAMLTGESQNREQVIDSFQNDPENRFFLITMKAGGTGLNLTSADYVFLLDPWWNPAVENQALSRAHRIGQEKKVFVYRFITTNSIEEKILKFKTRKSELADLFINTNNPFQKISKEEIAELFD